MSLKFYLNKLLKVDNIENYTLNALKELQECYDQFIEKSEGSDPDFPFITFNTKGTQIKGTNAWIAHEGDESFDGLRDRFGRKLLNSKEQKENFDYLEKVKRENNN